MITVAYVCNSKKLYKCLPHSCVMLSIIVPLYNEERRALDFLQQLTKFCVDLTKQQVQCEILLVDDGSKDNTPLIIKQAAEQYPFIKIISYPQNKGKGWAVQNGVMSARGEKIIFIDADGSIAPQQIRQMMEKLDSYDLVVGDRSSQYSKVEQSFTRHVTGKLFNTYTRLLFLSNIKDHLCGFKGFKKQVAKNLFQDLMTQRWLFDVELFFKAKQAGYTCYQLPLVWSHKAESKMKLTDPLKMALELLLLRVKLMQKQKK